MIGTIGLRCPIQFLAVSIRIRSISIMPGKGPRPPLPTEQTPLVSNATKNGSGSCKADPDPPSPPSMVRVSSSHSLWDGWGDYRQEMYVDEAELQQLAKALEREKGKHELLGEWRASSICSNDILSSCFYTIGLVTSYSGKMVRA